jgi:hypothetical protein
MHSTIILLLIKSSSRNKKKKKKCNSNWGAANIFFKEYCKTFCQMSRIHPVTARRAPQWQISSHHHIATIPICVKLFPLQYSLVATVFIHTHTHTQFLLCHICVHIYILHNIKTGRTREKWKDSSEWRKSFHVPFWARVLQIGESCSSEWSIDSQAVLSVEAFAATEFNKLFLVQTATSGCEGFQTFRQVTDSSWNVCYLSEESFIESRRCLLGIWRLVNG